MATFSERRNRLFAQCFLLVTCILSLVQCPYSKVEESFGIQAVHDLFYYGMSPAMRTSWNQVVGIVGQAEVEQLPYDHLQFPGVVPRTFLGPLLLSLACHLVRYILLPIMDLSQHPEAVLFLARLVQTLATAHAWFRLARALDVKTRTSQPGTWLLCVTACQFHLPFYASRMLANSLATIGTLHCYSFWLMDMVPAAAACLVAVTAIVRCDLLLLLFSVGLSWLLKRRLTVMQAVGIGVQSGLTSLLLTVPLDSILWQRPLWPEGEVLYVNTVLGKSRDYGVSAWHWYWTSALPKALLLMSLLVPLAVLRLPEKLVYWERRWKAGHHNSGFAISWLDTRFQEYILPAFGFVALYSILGHKEVRFLFPVLPLFNMAAAVGMTRLAGCALQPVKGKTSFSAVGWLAYTAGNAILALSLGASLAFLQVSRHNYPGGEALDQLITHVQATQPAVVVVHVDVAAAMTGVSLFGQRAAQLKTTNTKWSFEKAGYEESNQHDESEIAFTHLLSERADVAGFQVVAVSQGSPRLDLRHGTIQTADAIYILEREQK